VYYTFQEKRCPRQRKTHLFNGYQQGRYCGGQNKQPRDSSVDSFSGAYIRVSVSPNAGSRRSITLQQVLIFQFNVPDILIESVAILETKLR